MPDTVTAVYSDKEVAIPLEKLLFLGISLNGVDYTVRLRDQLVVEVSKKDEKVVENRS